MRKCVNNWHVGACYFSFVPGRMPVPNLADRTLERRTDLAHSGPWQVLHVSPAKRVSTCRQTKHDFVEFRKRVYGLAIRARAGGSGRENPLQQHKAVEWRANHDDNDAGGTLHCRLVRSSYFCTSHLFHFVIVHFIIYKYLYREKPFSFCKFQEHKSAREDALIIYVCSNYYFIILKVRDAIYYFIILKSSRWKIATWRVYEDFRSWKKKCVAEKKILRENLIHGIA